MNIVDFFLKNDFLNSNGEVGEDTGFDYLVNIFAATRDVEKLLEISRDYKGEKYKRLVDLAINFKRFDIAMDIALANHDYELCKQIRIESMPKIPNRKSQINPFIKTTSNEAIQDFNIIIEFLISNNEDENIEETENK